MVNPMAIAAINWAYGQTGLKPAEKFVLVTLADRSNASEWSCYPSVRDLAERTGLHRTSVTRSLAKLEKLGLVKKENRMRDRGGYTSSTYTLNRPVEEQDSALDDVAQCDIAISHDATTLGAQCSHPSSTTLHPYIEEPSTNHQIESSKRITEKMCLAIYEKYPRRKGRAAALKAIKKAIKDFGYDELEAAVRAFAKEWNDRLANGDDIKFCPWPQKWFNDQRYHDEPDQEPQQKDTRTAPPSKEKSVWEIKQLRDTLSEQARQIKLRHCAEEAHFTEWDDHVKREEYRELQGEVAELTRQLKAKTNKGTIHSPDIKVNGPLGGLIGDIANKVTGGAA